MGGQRPHRSRVGDVCVLRVTYSVAPAAQQVVAHGVPGLQLDGFIQVILGGRQKTLAVVSRRSCSLAALCSDLICPASPTHKYFTNTPDTRDHGATACCCRHTPSLCFSILLQRVGVCSSPSPPRRRSEAADRRQRATQHLPEQHSPDISPIRGA